MLEFLHLCLIRRKSAPQKGLQAVRPSRGEVAGVGLR